MQDSNEWLSYNTISRVAYLSFNRPPANAYNLAFMQRFLTLVERANQDQAVGAVVINSRSNKFFCAGADIGEFASNSTSSNQRMVDQARAVLAAIEDSPKLYIAQIAGHALGGGLEIAMACDVRFAARGDYLLGLPEIKLGLIPGNGGTQRLVRLLGLGRALELLATGDSFSADSAASWGLINRLFEQSELERAVGEFAATVAANAPLALAATKQALRRGVELSMQDGLTLEQSLSDSLYESEDAQEGFNAHLQKRAPKFTGR